MYSRADLSRTVALVVAPSLTAVSTGAFAWEFRAADIQGEDLNRSNVAVAPIGTTVLVTHALVDTVPVSQHRTSAKGCSGARFEAAMAGIPAKAQRDTAAAQPIKRIRKVE